MVTATAKKIEYRSSACPSVSIRRLTSTSPARLTELGKQGWEVVSVDLTYHPSYSPAAQPGVSLPVLPQREVTDSPVLPATGARTHTRPGRTVGPLRLRTPALAPPRE